MFFEILYQRKSDDDDDDDSGERLKNVWSEGNTITVMEV